MTHVIHSMERVTLKCKKTADRFAQFHPYLTFTCAFIGIPLLILATIFVCASLFMLPVAWICGWL